MAQNFRNQITRATGTSPVVILAEADSYDAVIGIRCTNIVATPINVDVYIVRSAANYYLIKSAPIPTGSSLELIDGGSKVVIMSGDVLKARSSKTGSVDVAISYIDSISE